MPSTSSTIGRHRSRASSVDLESIGFARAADQPWANLDDQIAFLLARRPQHDHPDLGEDVVSIFIRPH